MHRVNILGEALDGLGRWYVAVPPFLIITFLAALFFLTGTGQERLQQASERLQRSATREQAIDQLQNSLTRSVGSLRSFLLTGDHKYHSAYDTSVATVVPWLERLGVVYKGSDSSLAEVRSLHLLIGKRLADLATTEAIQKTQGTAAAIA